MHALCAHHLMCFKKHNFYFYNTIYVKEFLIYLFIFFFQKKRDVTILTLNVNGSIPLTYLVTKPKNT